MFSLQKWNSFSRNDTESEVQMTPCAPSFWFWLLTDKNAEQSAVAAEAKIEMTSESSLFFSVTTDAKPVFSFQHNFDAAKQKTILTRTTKQQGGLSCQQPVRTHGWKARPEGLGERTAVAPCLTPSRQDPCARDCPAVSRLEARKPFKHCPNSTHLQT